MSGARALAVVVLACAFAACVGPTGEPLPLGPEIRLGDRPGAELQLVLDEPYTAFVLGKRWTLPPGTYEPEGGDKRGVYFRAPLPLERRRLPGNVFDDDPGALVEGGIYVDQPVGLPTPWLYCREEDGTLLYDTLPRDFRLTQGIFWRIVERAPP